MTYSFSRLKKRPNILICPLDWGIGHATRCIPIINELIQQNSNVIIGADNQPLELLKQEFPDLQFERFPGYQFSYPSNDKMALKMAKQTPAILAGIRSENKFLKELINKLNIDAVISDNRFGLYNTDIPSVFITHQINIQVPSKLKYIEPILYQINKSFIKKYNECWIPDWENGFTLSGDLSHERQKLSNVYFIGPQSRFGGDEQIQNTNIYTNDFIVIISGPEPQRSIFENLVLEQVIALNKRGIVVLGKPEMAESNYKIGKNVSIYSHLGSKALEEAIINSKIVICRSGYSSVMDLVALEKKAVFVPTPGQTEQEYLADYFSTKGKFLSMVQHDIDLQVALEKVDDYPGYKRAYVPLELKERINKLLGSL